MTSETVEAGAARVSDTAGTGPTLVSGASEAGPQPTPDGAAQRAPGTPLLPGPAARTLILGIDLSGRILQCDRHAPKLLGRSPGELLGAELGDLTTGTPEQKDALAGLIDAMRSGRESTTMLSLQTERGRTAEAVVTVQPMTATDPDLTALAVVRLPVPSDERFLDPAVMRRALLDDPFTRIGSTLDPALMRPGRIDRKIEFSLPDMEGRANILRIHAKSMSVERDIRWELISRMCPNATGAELRSVATEAGMFAIRARRKVATEKDFLTAVDKVIKGNLKFNSTASYMQYN